MQRNPFGGLAAALWSSGCSGVSSIAAMSALVVAVRSCVVTTSAIRFVHAVRDYTRRASAALVTNPPVGEVPAVTSRAFPRRNPHRGLERGMGGTPKSKHQTLPKPKNLYTQRHEPPNPQTRGSEPLPSTPSPAGYYPSSARWVVLPACIVEVFTPPKAPSNPKP